MYSDKDYRRDLIVGMNVLMISMNNEEAYYRWTYLVPDCVSQEDLWDMADDDELFKECVNLFCTLMNAYFKDGLFILGKLYE